MLHFNKKIILNVCIPLLLSSCYRVSPEKDKHPNIQEISDIKNSKFKIIKTAYNEFGTTSNFHFASARTEKSTVENLILLNKEFEELKKITFQSKYSRFAIFDHFILIIEDSKQLNSSNGMIKMNYPEFKKNSIEFITMPQTILDSIKNSFPDSLLNLFSHKTNATMQHFDSIYCLVMNKELAKGLNEVYEINYPSGGKYFILDYGDKTFYYKDNRRYFRESCWLHLQNNERVFPSKTSRIDPFDKAFTEWTTNRSLGGKQKSGYQYFRLKTKNKDLEFKKFLAQFFNPTPQFFEVYSSENRDSILLQESNSGSENTLYWIINQ